MTSCAQCGSANDPGSRFCGVCGARVEEPAVIAPPARLVAAGSPELTTETAVLPPVRGVFDPSEASLRMPVTRAPTIAIVLLLLFDAGLATAGALLMKAGLARPGVAQPGAESGSASGSGSGSAPTTASAPASATPAATGPATPPPAASGSQVAIAHPPPPTGDHHAAPIGSGAGAGTASQPAGGGSGSAGSNVNGIVSDLFGHPAAPPDAAVAAIKPPAPPDAAPPAPDAAAQGDMVDPYGNPPDAAPVPDAPDLPDASAADDQHTSDLADEVERKSAASQSRFTHCYEDSAKAYTPDQPLAGEVDIAFRVMPTGEVQNAAPVKNTTGSDKLADCLTAVISAWTFSPSDLTEPAVFVRPFRFDGH